MTESTNLLATIRRAIADPGPIVGPRNHELGETVANWSARAVLTTAVPAIEATVRAQVADAIRAEADRDDDGSSWGHGMNRAEQIARGPQDAPTAPAQPATNITVDTKTTDGSGNLLDRIRAAVHTPGGILPRRGGETFANWEARAAIAIVNPELDALTQRAEKAEATLERVRDLHNQWATSAESYELWTALGRALTTQDGQ